MVICPKCKNEIPLKKFIFLTNYNNIKCSSCFSELKANKKTNSILGAIGGGIGAGVTTLLLVTYQTSGELIFLLLLIPFLAAEFFGFTLISIKFMKLEIKEHYQDVHQPPPPAIKIN